MLRIVNYLCLSLILITASRGDDGESRPASSPALLQKVVVIGASASAGFTFSGAKHPIMHFVNAAVETPHDPYKSLANESFFFSPELNGKNQVEEAVDAQPSLVIGVDYLFWLGYGIVKSEDERVALLEKGLQFLETVSCPLIISEYPDMSPAIGKMLSKGQVPAKETFVKLNNRVREWAAKHPNVILVNLPELLDKLRNGDEVTIRGNQYPKGSTHALLQTDELHPTAEGTAVLTIITLDALCKARKDVSESAILWDAKKILEKVKLNTKPKTASRPASSPAK